MYAVVRKIPRGKVLTYGQLAELAGLPGAARLAGAAMRASKGLPWHRVLGKSGPRRGKIALHDPVAAAMQRQRLQREGVAVSEAGAVDLERHGWLALDDFTPSRRAPPRRPAKKARAARR